MKVKYKFFYVLLMFTLSLSNVEGQETTQSEDISSLMFKASTTNSELLWDRAVTLAKSTYESSNESEDLLQLCYVYYGKTGTLISKRDKEKGEKTIELGLASAEKLSLDSEYESVANALLGGFNGLSIAFSPMKGMVLGPKSDKQLNKSLKLDPENAIAWLQKGSSQYNTPRIFGGSVKESIESFKKSITYFEADQSMPVWMKIEAMIWLGQAYHYMEDYQKARETYNAVLDIAAGHQWIEKILLPATMAKLND